jgi:membrane dipeptidase
MEEFNEKLSAIDRSSGLSETQKIAKESDLLTHHYPLPQTIPSYELIFEHLDHVVKTVGDTHAALGSDFDGIPYPPAGLEDISKIGKIIERLHKRGYKDSRIERILTLNIARVIRAN